MKGAFRPLFLCGKYLKIICTNVAFLKSNKFTVMKGMKNKVQLIGHLGANPEIKVFDEN
jgi:hypothetical protein